MAQQSHRKVYIIALVVTVLMFGFCFAMVPLYGLLCKATGTNNTSKSGNVLAQATSTVGLSKTIDMSREVTVQFTTTNHMGLPWDFYPKVKSIKLHPGEKKTVYFYAKNTTRHDMTVQAIPSMTPTESLNHFHKIECFCFTQQSLRAGQAKEMPLVFQIDSDLPKEIHVMTLAYTLFDATPLIKGKG